MPTLEQLNAQLDRLAGFDAGPHPVVSVYLNLQADQHGRDNFEPFLRKELDDRLATYPASGPERASLTADAGKIRDYVQQLDPSDNGLALFSSSSANLFEAIALARAGRGAPAVHLRSAAPLPPREAARRVPRYAVMLADTRSARIFVFAANSVQQTEQIEGVKTRRHKMGGWSQARYQRHMENYHLQHAKEVVDALARITREEKIGSVVLAGDEVIVPLLRDQLTKDVAERVVDVLKLDIRAAEREVLESTLAALREKDSDTDRERVDALIGAYRAGGLAYVGVDAIRRAFELGQVDELVDRTH